MARIIKFCQEIIRLFCFLLSKSTIRSFEYYTCTLITSKLYILFLLFKTCSVIKNWLCSSVRYSQVSNKRACSFINFQHFAPSACSYSPLLKCKVYISSQTVHSANLEPKLSSIVLLFNTFSLARLLDFQKKSTLLDY